MHDDLRKIVSGVRSDDLTIFREFFKEGSTFYSALAPIAPLIRVDVILDANIILAQVIWLTKRKSPDARTELLEVINCETVTAYAPYYAIEEIEKHLPIISEKKKIALEKLHASWNQFKPHINFAHTDEPTEAEVAAAVDPKDLAYIKLQQKIGAPIYSRDPHIAAMQGRTITFQVIASLKDYSRSSAVEYQIKGLGIASLYITGITGQAVAELTKVITAQVKKLPVWGQWVGSALIAFLILNPKSRATILEGLRSVMKGTAIAGELFFEALLPLMAEHDKAKEAAVSALATIEDRSILIEQKAELNLNKAG